MGNADVEVDATPADATLMPSAPPAEDLARMAVVNDRPTASEILHEEEGDDVLPAETTPFVSEIAEPTPTIAATASKPKRAQTTAKASRNPTAKTSTINQPVRETRTAVDEAKNLELEIQSLRSQLIEKLIMQNEHLRTLLERYEND